MQCSSGSTSYLKQRERRQRTFATPPSNAMLAYTFLFVVFAAPASSAGLPGPLGPRGPPNLSTTHCNFANGRMTYSSSGLAYQCNPGYIIPKHSFDNACRTGVWCSVVCEPSPSTRVFKTDCDGRTNCVFVTRTSTGPRWVKEITRPKSSCDKGLSGKPAPERTTIPTLEEAAARASHKGSRGRRGEQGRDGPRGPARPDACYAGLPHTVTKATLKLPGNIRVTRSHLEIGPIRKSTMNKHIRFIVEGEGLGLHYSLHVRARCLPDPPSHLDEIGSVKEGYKSFRVSGDSRRRVHCLNIKDTVTKCSRFVLTFIGFALHRPGFPASLSLIPDGLYRECPRGTIDNP